MARVAGPRCLAVDPLLGCVPACMSPVVAIAPGNVCHGPRCSLSGLDQWPCSTAPVTGPAGRLGRPSASDPGGVVRCTLSLCCPRCVCLSGVLGHLAPVHRCARPLCSVRGVRGHLALVQRCARCVWHVCVGGFVGDPPSFLCFGPCLFVLLFGALVLLCLLCNFLLCYLAFVSPPLLFFFLKEKQ